jgi:tRNA A-37 threonylcarbamoyl transferase component Bud32
MFSFPLSSGIKKFTLFSLAPPPKGNYLVEVEDINRKLAFLTLGANLLKTKPDNLNVYKREYLDDLAESGSQDDIYYLTNLHKEKLIVLKVKAKNSLYQGPSKELKAMDYMGKISFNHFHTAKLLGSENMTFGTEMYEVIAMTMAPGVSLNHYLQKISALPAGSKERETSLKELQDAINLTAIALAELHNKEVKTSLNLVYEKQKEYVIERFKKKSKTSLKQPLIDHLNSLKDTSPKGLIHGDLNPGNIFYDKSTKQVTFIDLDTSFDSIKGGPIAYDLAHFSLLFEALGVFYEFNEEEQTILNRSFFQTYAKYGPVISSESKSYYRYILEMSYISGFNIDHNLIDINPQTLQASALSAYFEKDLKLKTASISTAIS